jgi:hypothetical protein
MSQAVIMSDTSEVQAGSRNESPQLSGRRNNLFPSNDNFGFFSIPFEKFREDALSEWTSALTLLGKVPSAKRVCPNQ